MRSSIGDAYGRLFDRLWSCGWWPQAAMLLLVTAATVGASGIRLDMSFRPLFVADGAIAAQTEEFEKEFGQISGAWIAAIVVADDWDAPLGRSLIERVSERVSRVDHVLDVISISRPPGPGSQRSPVERLLTDDGRTTVLLARLDLPLADLSGRRPVVAAFREAVQRELPAGVPAYFTGVSVVEDVYADEVLKYLLVGVALTVSGVALMIWLLWGRLERVLIAMAGTSCATTLVLALMAALDQHITLVSSMVPTVVMVIGVADAIHMISCFDDHRRRAGQSPRGAARLMVQEMAVPCLMTTLTTMGGLAALQAAGLPAIRDFGLSAIVGVALAYLANQVLVPALLARREPRIQMPAGPGVRLARRWSLLIGRQAIRHPVSVVGVALLLFIGALAGLGQLRFDQRFNEELGPSHPVAAAQRLFETHFGGLLGPELVIYRTDGGSLLNPESLAALRAFSTTVSRDSRVISVHSVADAWRDGGEKPAAMTDLIEAKKLPVLVSAGADRVAVIIRVADLGTDGAIAFVDSLREIAAATLGPEMEILVVGQWWLAQLGMAGLIDDLVSSFAWAFLLITPLILIGLRHGGLALAGLLPNLLPLAVAMGFMAWAGISVRIGTAMVLAIALGIAVDDSLHMLSRYRHERLRGTQADHILARTLRHTGPALMATTAVLAIGFLSMLSSGLVAIRDMGLVATVTLLTALFADLVLLPAQIILVRRIRGAWARAGRAPEPC